MNYKLDKFVGQKFNKWTILSIIRGKNLNGKAWGKFKCRCECGFEKLVPSGDILKNKSKQCRKCSYVERQSQYNDLTNKKFNKWTVIKYSKRNEEYRKIIWECKCECGRIGLVQGSNLTQNLSKGCGLCDEDKQLEHRLMKKLENNANERDFEIDKRINGKILIELFIKQEEKCALSGVPISLGLDWRNSGTASLDRIDSSKGYLLNNIQWVHKDINMMKMDLPEDRFVFLCKSVAKTSCFFTKIKGLS